MRKVKQVRTYEDPDSVAAWRRSSATRAGYLAAPTARMLDLARIRQGDRVLAIGVGTGDEAILAAARVGPDGAVVATDASAPMIAEAKRAVNRARLANVSCLLMDGQTLNFVSESFDAVIARNVLMFIPDLPRALGEMWRVLKDAGRMSATVWSSAQANPRLSGPLEAARSLGIRPSPAATFRLAIRLGEPHVLTKALRRAGFAEIEVERIPVVATYPTVAAAVQQAMEHGGTKELVTLLPVGSETRMRTSLSKLWQRYRASGSVRLPGEQLVFAATRRTVGLEGASAVVQRATPTPKVASTNASGK